MTIGEKNIRAWNEQLGLKDKYIKEGIEQGENKNRRRVAQKMLRKGFSLEDIIDTTELTREVVMELQSEVEGGNHDV